VNITSPKQLEGKTLGAPVDDAPFKLFPAFAKATGIDASKVTWKHMQPSLREQMLVRGEVDAISGYVNTVWFSLRKIYPNPGDKVNVLRYSDFGLDLYSNAIIVSKEFIEKQPKAVEGFLRAFAKGFQDVLKDPGSKPPKHTPKRPKHVKSDDEWSQRREKALLWCQSIRSDNNPWWKGSVCAKVQIGGRVYHEAYPDGRWRSYDYSARAKGISGYQFRAEAEWFAELYAAYFGGKLKDSHPAMRWLVQFKPQPA